MQELRTNFGRADCGGAYLAMLASTLPTKPSQVPYGDDESGPLLGKP